MQPTNVKEHLCACKKSTERTEEQIKDISNRINRLTGQLNGVKKMIEENRYCIDILIQLSAIDKAVKGLASLIMEDHLKTCVVEKIQKGNTQVVDEITDIFKRFN